MSRKSKKSRRFPNHRGRLKATASFPRRRLLSLVVAQALSVPLITQAATIEVTSISDSGTGCTFREAIVSINNMALETGCSNSGGAFGTDDEVIFNGSVAGGTITLTAGEISLDKDISINSGGSETTVNANSNSRIFTSNTANLQIELEQLVLTGGNTAGNGGAINITGANTNLTLMDSTITGNTATNAGGGIYLSSASVTLTNSTVSSNVTSYDGGGIKALNSSSVSLVGSTLSANTAGTRGGGLYAGNSGASLTTSTVSRNTASTGGGGIAAKNSAEITMIETTIAGNRLIGGGGYNGGGLFAESNSSLDLNNSTVSANTAPYSGGIFVSDYSDATLANTTVSGNSANQAGGIRVSNTATLTMENSTIANNSADSAAGLQAVLTSNVTLTNTIIADSEGGQDCSKDGGTTVTANADNIIENDACLTSATNVDPMLSRLAHHGGSTLTHALTSGSQAINAGDNTDCGTGKTIEFDQRGASRNDGFCDIGAYEFIVPASIEVTSALDDGTDCTLREAIVSVNNSALEPGCSTTGGTLGAAYGIDEVTFHPSVAGQTITLSGSQIPISRSVSINPGGTQTTIDAAGNSRIFYAGVLDIHATLDALTLTGGMTVGDGFPTGYGGAVLFTATSFLTLKNSTVTGNTADGNTDIGVGGGISLGYATDLALIDSTVSSNSAANYGGGIGTLGSTLELQNSTISGNTAGYDCGGIDAADSHVTFTGSTLSNNAATYFGGGLCGSGATVHMMNSNVTGNSVTEYDGGGFTASNYAEITVGNSTISNNSVSGNYGYGGGIALTSGANLVLTQSTVSGNSASGAFGSGGGISVLSASVVLTQSTISGNSASYNGGGAYVYSSNATLTLTNSTISGNTADSGGGVGTFSDGEVTIVNSTIASNSAPNGGGLHLYESGLNSPTANLTNTIIANSSGGSDCDTDGVVTITAGSDNIIESDNCGTSATNGDPSLLGLADNGGSTETHALSFSSAAIDAGDNTNCGAGKAVDIDQRGESRDDGSCDIGAYEFQGIDFGDAPDPTYPTLNASNGARHEIGGLILGASRDADADGQPTAAADGDDLNNNDDEDGITFDTAPTTGTNTTLTVNITLGPGNLDAWIDFNADGDWDDAGEQIFTSEPVNNGANVLSITTPIDATEGTTFSRFRVSTDGGLAPTGSAADGEVEDYQVTILDGDTDNDGMSDQYEIDNGLDPDVDDSGGDLDGDGLTNLEEFNLGTRADNIDTDADGIGDALDNDPTVASNQCNGDTAILSSLNVPFGSILQCAAETSIEVQSSVTIQSGGRLELISPILTFGDGFSVPTGGEVSVDSRDPTPP